MENNNDSSDKIDEPKDFIFSDDEVSIIRQYFNRQVKLPAELAEKIRTDPLCDEYRIILFLPEIGDRIAKNNERPTVEFFNNGTRDFVEKVSFSDCVYIVKTIENTNEPAIAKTMAEIGVGPQQIESLSGFITEKFIEGKAISKLDPATCTPDFMKIIGQKIGEGIKKIHEKGILINDQLLSDDFSKSHTIITPEGEVYFIDFGASVDLNNFPEMTDEEVALIIRSDAYSFFSFSNCPKEKRKAYIDEYRKDRIGRFKNKEEVISRYDGQLITEGLSFLSNRIDNVRSLVAGLNEPLIEKTN